MPPLRWRWADDCEPARRGALITICRRGRVWFVPDVPPAPDELTAPRAANARLREVTVAKDAEIGMLRGLAAGATLELAGHPDEVVTHER